MVWGDCHALLVEVAVVLGVLLKRGQDASRRVVSMDVPLYITSVFFYGIEYGS